MTSPRNTPRKPRKPAPGAKLGRPSRACDCCRGEGHKGACCPGYFRNAETREIERCDECAIYPNDEAAAVAARAKAKRPAPARAARSVPDVAVAIDEKRADVRSDSGQRYVFRVAAALLPDKPLRCLGLLERFGDKRKSTVSARRLYSAGKVAGLLSAAALLNQAGLIRSDLAQRAEIQHALIQRAKNVAYETGAVTE